MAVDKKSKSQGGPRPTAEALSPLPRSTRWLLLLLGWTLLMVGLIGLVLPGIQGILTLLAGAAVLSLVDPALEQWLDRRLRRRPWARQKLHNLRRRIHRWVS